MKRICFKFITLVLVTMAVILSFGGCFDIDEMAIDFGVYEENNDVNKKIEVMFRSSDGVTCTDSEYARSVYSGEKVTFNIRIDSSYIYLGNSANALYVPETGKLIIESAKAPMTVDVYVVYKSDTYYLEISEMPNVRVQMTSGQIWSNDSHTVMLEAQFAQEYRFLCWTIGNPWVENSQYNDIVSYSETFEYEISKKGITTIYANVIPDEDYYPGII